MLEGARETALMLKHLREILKVIPNAFGMWHSTAAAPQVFQDTDTFYLGTRTAQASI